MGGSKRDGHAMAVPDFLEVGRKILAAGLWVSFMKNSTIEDLEKTVRGEKVPDLAHMAAGALAMIRLLEEQVKKLNEQIVARASLSVAEGAE